MKKNKVTKNPVEEFSDLQNMSDNDMPLPVLMKGITCIPSPQGQSGPPLTKLKVVAPIVTRTIPVNKPIENLSKKLLADKYRIRIIEGVNYRKFEKKKQAPSKFQDDITNMKRAMKKMNIRNKLFHNN